MHDDRDVIEQRIRRELRDRVRPLTYLDRRSLAIEAGPDLDSLSDFEAGGAWGAPWGTTWFRLSGEIPDAWASARVEAVVDLGFSPHAAGFQCEGLVVEPDGQGGFRPIQGIHPRRTNVALDAKPGPVELLVEAASNPMVFFAFAPTPLGSPATAGDKTLYRFRTAELVVVDPAAEALVHEIDVLDGFMLTLASTDPRRARLLRALAAALDVIPDVDAASRVLQPVLAEDGGGATRHRVVAAGHAHIDTAWLWPIRETKRKCTRTFASATRLMDDYPEYRFVVSSAQHYAWIEEQHPELFERIAERVRRGQWIPIGGMWVESDMNLPSGESLARQIVHGQRYFDEKFGMRCTEVWIPDVFGYPAGLPQLFAAGGMRRFVTQKMSWNKQNRFPHNTFWWEGLDGTRVLTHFPPVDTYNAELTPDELDRSVTNFRDHGWSSESLVPFGHGDGGGGPTREMLERARRLATLDSRATLEIGTPSEMFDRIEASIAAGAPAPVWRGELYFETHRGTLTSQLHTKLGNRRCERLLVEAELWAATLVRSADVDELWHEVLTHQFHDILPGSSIAWVHEEAEAVFQRVAAELEDRIAAALNELTAAGDSLCVANRADTAVDEVIVIDGDLAADLLDASDSSVQSLTDGSVAVRVAAPALAAVPLARVECDDQVAVTATSMSNDALEVRWNAVGDLVSIVDRETGRELIPTGHSAAVLEIAPDHPVEYDAWDLESWTRSAARSVGEGVGDSVVVEVVERGPLLGRVRVTRSFGPSECVVTYGLRAGSPQLDVHIALDWHHDEHLLSIAFPLDVRADNAMCDVQFGVVARPTHASSSWDAAKFEVCAHRFVDLAEPDFGVAILNDGRFGHCVFDGAVRVSLARAAKYPDPGADHGHHEVTLAVFPHGHGLADVRDAASRLQQPVRVVRGGDRAPDPVVRVLAPDGSPARGVEVDAVKLADDGTGHLVVRLHEALGNRTRIAVAPARAATVASRCNLLEEVESPVDVVDGRAELELRPFELVTLRLGA